MNAGTVHILLIQAGAPAHGTGLPTSVNPVTPSLGLDPVTLTVRWAITGIGVWRAAPASCPAVGKVVPGLRLWPLAGLSPSVQTLSLSITPTQTAAWRKQIFQQLTERTKRELESFRHYEQAVEQVGPLVCSFGVFSLGIGSHRIPPTLALNLLIAQVSLTLVIQLLQPPECWGHRHSLFQLAPAICQPHGGEVRADTGPTCSAELPDPRADPSLQNQVGGLILYPEGLFSGSHHHQDTMWTLGIQNPQREVQAERKDKMGLPSVPIPPFL